MSSCRVEVLQASPPTSTFVKEDIWTAVLDAPGFSLDPGLQLRDPSGGVWVICGGVRGLGWKWKENLSPWARVIRIQRKLGTHELSPGDILFPTD